MYSRLDGSGTNPDHSTWGTDRQPVEFISTGPGYGDHVSTPAGARRPSPRLISNVLFTSQFKWNTVQDVNSWFPFFGQWLAHDMILQPGPGPDFPIKVPRCDAVFDVNCTNTQEIPFQRHLGSITSKGYLQGGNEATSWIDLSTVYSNVPSRMAQLRTFSGGLLKTSVGPNGQLLPRNSNGFPNAGGESRKDLFLAGDPRCNVNLLLLSLHTLFHLEHNRKAKALALLHPDWTDETLFQEARKFTIAVNQKIAFTEYLPKLLGKGLPHYNGFDPTANPAVDSAFMSAAFRYGHSSTGDLIYRFEESRIPFVEGHLTVGETIFNPAEVHRHGLDMVLRGVVMQPEADAGARMVPGIRSHPVLFDMAAIDIQRGRDRGVPDYNTARVAMGFPRVNNFAQVTNDTAILSVLNTLYTNMSDIDLYVGGLVEAHTTGSVVGPLFASIISAQFTRSRNADPFFYLRSGVFSPDQLSEIQSRSLSRMILDHTNVKWMPADLFALESSFEPETGSTGSSSLLKSSITPMPGYTMSWAIDTLAQVWKVSITSQKGGWVGVGFGSQMAGSDVIVAYIQDGAPTVVDAIVLGQFQTTPTSDVNNGHTNDIIDGSVKGAITNGVLTVSFTRKISTGDPTDKVIIPDMMPMIFAHGSTTKPAQHGLFGRSLAIVNLYTDVVVFDSSEVFRLDSGVAMTFQLTGITMALIQTILILGVIKARRVREVFFAGPSLIITSLLGYILFSVHLYLLSIEQTQSICTIRTFLPSLAFSMIYSINSGKLYRLHRIFSSRGGAVIKITNSRILAVTLALAILDITLGGILVISSPMVIQPETPNTCPVSLTSLVIGTIRIFISLSVCGLGSWSYLMLQDEEGATFALFRRETETSGRISIVVIAFFAVMTLINFITPASVFQKTTILIQCLTMLFFTIAPFSFAVVRHLDLNRVEASVLKKYASNQSALGTTRGGFEKPDEASVGDSEVPPKGGTLRRHGTAKTRDNIVDKTTADREATVASMEKVLQIKRDEVAKTVLEFKTMENMMRKVSDKFNQALEQTLRLERELEYYKETA